MGYTDREALLLITHIAQAAADIILDLGEYETSWVMAIHDEARGQLQRHARGDE